MAKDRFRDVVIGSRTFNVEEDFLSSQSQYFAALFGQNFKEAREDQIVLKEVDPDSFELILQYYSTESLDFDTLKVPKTIELIKTSNKLLFDELTRKCEKQLTKNIFKSDDEILSVLKVSSDLELQELYKVCLRRVTRSFESLAINQLSELDEKLLTNVLLSPDIESTADRILDVVQEWSTFWKGDPSNILHSLVLSQVDLLSVLHKHTVSHPSLFTRSPVKPEEVLATIETLKALKAENLRVTTELRELFGIDARRLSLVPSILLSRINPDENLPQRVWNKDRTIFCATFYPHTAELQDKFELKELYLSSGVTPTGCRVVSLGEEFIISGGEYSLGRNSWNTDIIKYSFSTGKCTTIGKLSEPRRHHSAVVVQGNLFLLGGFSKIRVKLNSMVKINLTTGEETECAPVPRPVFKAAAVEWQDKLLLVEGGEVCVYDPHLDSWTTIPLEKKNLPENMEFHAAMKSLISIYLTSTYSTTVYRLSIDGLTTAHIEKIGAFKREAQNPCCIGDQIYNFSMDEFSDERTIEMLDSDTGSSRILWSADDPLLDFSSLSIMAAFPVHTRC